MQVPSLDTRVAVEYISRITGELTTDICDKGAGLVAITTMMDNIKANDHVNPTYIRVAVVDERAEIYLPIGCEFCQRGTGIRAFSIRIYTDEHGHQYYACGFCGPAHGLDKVA